MYMKMSIASITLWPDVWRILQELRPAFSRVRTFLWFATAVVGFCTRGDLAGVTSFVRGLGLTEECYDRLLDFFHSKGIDLDCLTRLWSALVIRVFPLVKINGRPVLVADGIKVPKEGKKMPGVKLLHQESQSNSKPEYIMGHSCQAVSILAGVDSYAVAIPLAARIHDGIVSCNRWKKTLLDKLFDLVVSLSITVPYYMVADAYYASGSLAGRFLQTGNHLVTRVRKNAVAFHKATQPNKRRKGRPKLYGEKIALRTIFDDLTPFTTTKSPVYGELDTDISYRSLDLIWKPAQRLMRFVFVAHPQRGNIILMTSDLSLSPVDIIKLYGLRFKIEVGFKSDRHQIGTYSYHFWTLIMKPIRRGSGNQYLHRQTAVYRKAILRKLAAFHAFIQTGIIAHGLLLFLSLTKTSAVWKSFGSWLRTIRPGVLPSEQVVMLALKNSLPHFLADDAANSHLQKFIADRIDLNRAEGFRLIA